MKVEERVCDSYGRDLLFAEPGSRRHGKTDRHLPTIWNTSEPRASNSFTLDSASGHKTMQS
jgi:hypothetical protein